MFRLTTPTRWKHYYCAIPLPSSIFIYSWPCNYNKTKTTNKASPVDRFGAPDSWLAMDWATVTPASLLDCSWALSLQQRPADRREISWLCCTELDSIAIAVARWCRELSLPRQRHRRLQLQRPALHYLMLQWLLPGLAAVRVIASSLSVHMRISSSTLIPVPYPFCTSVPYPCSLPFPVNSV